MSAAASGHGRAHTLMMRAWRDFAARVAKDGPVEPSFRRLDEAHEAYDAAVCSGDDDAAKVAATRLALARTARMKALRFGEEVGT